MIQAPHSHTQHTPLRYSRPPWSSGNATGLSSGRFESRPDLARSETGRILSIGASMATVIRAPSELLHAPNHYNHFYMYACWEVRQLLFEGRQFPPGTQVSSPINLTATIWPKMLKVALNTNQSNPISYVTPYVGISASYLQNIGGYL